MGLEQLTKEEFVCREDAIKKIWVASFINSVAC